MSFFSSGAHDVTLVWPYVCDTSFTYIGMQVDFNELSKAALAARDPAEGLPSGQAELYEIWLSRYIK